MQSSQNQNSPSFKLVDGVCHLQPKYLLVSAKGDVNEVLRKKESNSYPLYSRLMLMLTGGLALLAVFSIIQKRNGEVIALAIGIALCLYFILRWRGKSNTVIIERKKIRNIQLKRIHSNPTFVVLFQDPQGKFKKRYLVMKAEDTQQMDHALRLLRSQNLLSGQSINQQSSYQPDFEKESKQIAQAHDRAYSTPKKEEKTNAKINYKRNKDGYLKDY